MYEKINTDCKCLMVNNFGACGKHIDTVVAIGIEI